MEIITQNAERELESFIKSINYDIYSWECVHIAFSRLCNKFTENLNNSSVESYRKLTENLVRLAMQEPLQNEYGKIFMCFDNDAFAVFKPSSDSILERLSTLSEKFISKNLDDLYYVYNLGEKRLDFEKLARMKTKQMALQKLKEASILTTSGPKENNINLEKLDLKLKARAHRVKNIVLIVDDEEAPLMILQRYLPKNCYCYTAQFGKEAILKYIDLAPDIVILDIHLPDMDGLDILNQLRDFDNDAFVIMASGDSVTDNVIKSKNMGAVGFLAKPFSEKIICDYVTKCPTINRGYHGEALPRIINSQDS